MGGGGNVVSWPERRHEQRTADGSADDQRQPDAAAELERRRRRLGGQRGDESAVFIGWRSARRSPSAFSARCNATRTATSLIESRAAVAAIDWPSSEIAVTMSR